RQRSQRHHPNHEPPRRHRPTTGPWPPWHHPERREVARWPTTVSERCTIRCTDSWRPAATSWGPGGTATLAASGSWWSEATASRRPPSQWRCTASTASGTARRTCPRSRGVPITEGDAAEADARQASPPPGGERKGAGEGKGGAERPAGS